MGDLINSRWFKWDRWFNEKNYVNIISDFDRMVKNKDAICIGDIVRRDSALEELGICSMSKHKQRGKSGK